jgi:hypothetical protein
MCQSFFTFQTRLAAVKEIPLKKEANVVTSSQA